ncbi:hypothetical protein KR032_012407, partial [Drosophila birchii]
ENMWKLVIFAVLVPLIAPSSGWKGWAYGKVDCTVNGTQTRDCTPSCPETCELNGDGGCIRMCGGPCVCKPGYVIDPSIPACVLRSDCPKDVVQQQGTTVVMNFKCFSNSPCK